MKLAIFNSLVTAWCTCVTSWRMSRVSAIYGWNRRFYDILLSAFY